MAPLQTADFSSPPSVSNSMNSGSIKDYGEIRSAREATTLEQCVNQQRTNVDYIDNISSRINGLIRKLRGHSVTGCDESDVKQSEGLLGDHKIALEYEAQRLGEIQADLAELERLL